MIDPTTVLNLATTPLDGDHRLDLRLGEHLCPYCVTRLDETIERFKHVQVGGSDERLELFMAWLEVAEEVQSWERGQETATQKAGIDLDVLRILCNGRIVPGREVRMRRLTGRAIARARVAHILSALMEGAEVLPA